MLFPGRRRAFPANQAQTPQTLFVARPNRHKPHFFDATVFVAAHGRRQRRIKRNRQSLGLSASLAPQSNQRSLLSRLQIARVGVRVRLILDPNETGRSGGTSGLPNQPVASELVSRSGGAIRVRWYRTHGERFHAAVVMIYGTGRAWLTLGSAQLTRRNLDDYNLEANVAIEMARGAPLMQQALQYFDTLWSNRAGLGIEYTGDFAAFADPAQSDYWLYRVAEGTGFSPF